MGFTGNTIADLRSHVAYYASDEVTPSRRSGEGMVWQEAEMLAHREGVGHGKRETAGLIMEVWGRDGQLVGLDWHVFNNEADDGTGEFYVSGQQVGDLLRRVQGARLELRKAALWHSHHGEQAEPSTLDVESFPSWLCSVGFIYHVPTGTTLAYEGRQGSSLSGDSPIRGEAS